MRQTEWRYYNGNENCIDGCSPEECFPIKRLQNYVEKSTNDTKFCIPVPLENFYSNKTDFNYCFDTNGDGHLSSKVMIQFSKHMDEQVFNCQKPKVESQYPANIRLSQTPNTNDKKITFNIDFKISSKTVNEEILIYDTPTFIGTLGGFLGLFIGFSFYGFFVDIFVLFLNSTPLKNNS